MASNMGIPEDLKQYITDGDYQYIADLFAERHQLAGDCKTVHREYVRKVLLGMRPAAEGTAAEEIMLIAIKYLKHKRDFRETILI